ncbi:MAG TPA: YfhO family protein, partial [Chloroflexota bacterium]|nr:YfhO family protein [Chloroflexota bacterium]
LWYASGPDGGLFRVLARLPGFRSIDLPMHGWFLPALGLALLGGAGLLKLPPRWRLAVLGLVFVDTLLVNQIANPLAFARSSFDALYGAPLARFARQIAASDLPPDRVYGAPLSAVGYRNHSLQSRIATTYGYNPLELAGYAMYESAAEANPRLIDGLAATHALIATGVETRHTMLPLAYLASHVTSIADDIAADQALSTLDPATDTLVVGGLPPVAEPDPRAEATVVDHGPDRLTVHYRSATQSLLRVAVPNYPGWQATLGSRELLVLTVDRALLGIVVPAGEADIEVRYVPRLFGPGLAVSLLALVACGAVVSRRARRAARQVIRRAR